MIQVQHLTDKPAAVLGLGRAGLAACRALMAGGTEVWAWDDNETPRTAAAAESIPLVDLHRCDWTKPGALVLSPGIPHTHPRPHPVARMAREAGCPLTGDVELLYRTQIGATYVGITGTNGKSTTTALVGHILESTGRRSQVGANLGTPALELAPLGEGDVYVLELSSYQLELTERTIFDVAVLLNISPDHLERHGGMSGYMAAKLNVFAHHDEDCTAVIGIDDERCRALYEDLKAEGGLTLIPISGMQAVARGVYALNGILHDGAGPVLDLGTVATLPGAHNWQNAAAAFAVASALGLDREEIAAGLATYPGLPHRQEMVAEIEGIRFVNDSKATNADAAARALSSYDTIFWIAGGQAKETGLQGIEPWLSRVCHAYLIGEAAAAFTETLDGTVPTTVCSTLDTAVKAAFEAARGVESAVVLLSPACASFDQYPGFEARGDSFRKLVEELR